MPEVKACVTLMRAAFTLPRERCMAPTTLAPTPSIMPTPLMSIMMGPMRFIAASP